MKPRQPLLLIDGCTGEGGGQLVRLACALAAVTSSPIRITNVRGNRDRGGGLKSQHVSAIEWLAKATQAEVKGLAVGSRTLEFRPTAPPTTVKDRKIVITAESRGASALLILQAVFPYLLFAGNENGDPIELEIRGSTNASFSPSYEYLDQVLLPTLEERFGILVERQLRKRAWTIGPIDQGTIWVKFQPISPGKTLKLVKPWNSERQPGDLDKIKRIDVTILVPYAMREPMENAMVEYLGAEFPEAEISFIVNEESGHDARMYVLAVAHSESGLRWGRDFLYDRSRKKKQITTIAKEIAKTVTKRLWEQTTVHTAAVDEYLHDQLVVFQVLAEGRTTYWSRATERQDDEARPDRAGDVDEINRDLENLSLGKTEKKDKTHRPFGFGSTHATTARWVASELLPTVQWFNNGTICEGAGISS
ncbi:RNA 3'-terminal phosphate cyclase-domain-containing protein [Xylaria flabelliformis]|nr:RNA 3'-terminal phosphate cyclase-domain-containing protein [Xylaria flabelliformis]